MNVSLTPKLEKYIQAKVKTGRYTSASEVVREAIRLLELNDERERERAQELRHFQEELDRRIAEADAGNLIDGETFMADLKRRMKALRKQSA